MFLSVFKNKQKTEHAHRSLGHYSDFNAQPQSEQTQNGFKSK